MAHYLHKKVRCVASTRSAVLPWGWAIPEGDTSVLSWQEGYPCPVPARQGGTSDLSFPGGTPVLSWLGYPRTRVSLLVLGYPCLRLGYSQKGPGTNHLGTLMQKATGTSEWVPPGKDMGPVEVLWDGDEEIPLGVHGQAK